MVNLNQIEPMYDEYKEQCFYESQNCEIAENDQYDQEIISKKVSVFASNGQPKLN